MAWWLTADVSQPAEPASNYSTVNVLVSLNWNSYSSYGNYVGMTGTIYIDYNAYTYTAPSSVNVSPNNATGSVVIAGASRRYDHDNNGYRGPVHVEADLNGRGGYAPGYIAITPADLPAVDFDRKPSDPSTITPTLNADKTIDVISNAVSSPAGTPTYYISYSSNGGSTWSSDITIPGNARSYRFEVGSLTFGLTYKFRMRVSNSDGTSGYTTTTTDTFLPAGGKRFDGSTWNATGTAQRFNGTSWVTLTTAKKFDGTNWQNLS